VALVPAQSSDEAFERLDPLFRQTGTTHQRSGDTLTFQKKDSAAQDKMSIFDGGVLHIEHAETGPMLRYHLTSRALLFCFLAPLLFLGIAQLTVAIGKADKPVAEAGAKAGKVAHAPPKPAEKKALPFNAIDKALGAPAPEKPKKDGEDGPGKSKKPKSTPAYVFAGIFAALYIVGRILEDRLVKALFQKRLQGA
jgi:hypothetical protein